MYTKMDRAYMAKALELAKKGFPKTWPNPMVGAVIVKQNRIIAQGWHHCCGGPHAEVHALKQAGKKARNAIMYLTLEPCSHYGRTPPCSNALIQAGIKKVYCAMKDPNPKVSGKGFAQLRKAGIQVEVGLARKEAQVLNRVFIKRITTGLPYVVNKAAMSLDGKIACANGSSRWISGFQARKYAHKLRAIADAVIVGAHTVIQDDPELSVRYCRLQSGKQPMRIIIAGRTPLPLGMKMLKTKRKQPIVIVVAESLYKKHDYPEGVDVWPLRGKHGYVDLVALLEKLGEQKMSFILVEGGADLHASFLGLGSSGSCLLSDEVHMVLAPKIIGNKSATGPVGGIGVKHPDSAIRLRNMELKLLGPDLLVRAEPYWNKNNHGKDKKGRCESCLPG